MTSQTTALAVAVRQRATARLYAVSVGLVGAVIALFALASLGWAQGPGPLVAELFGGGNKALVVVLHGDLSRGGPATYHVSFARKIAAQNSGITVAALIRPGYQSGSGAQSPGSNTNRRDHYTRRNNTLVANTIRNLQAATGASRVVVVGHSGGAAQIGGVLGATKGLIDSAILVACPCDIRRWRQMNNRSAWSKSQSPIRLVNKIDKGTRVIAITGSQDGNTAPVLARAYIGAVQKAGIAAGYIEVPGADHGWRSLERAALRSVNAEIRR